MTFDKLDTAQRMREVIRRLSEEQARRVAPPALIARMTQVDITNRTGEAWIIGDKDSVPVILSDGLYPGKWDAKDFGPNSEVSAVGTGSTVVLQNFNGRLYVTQVLSGGRLLYQADMLGMHLTSQLSDVAERNYVGGRSHVGTPHEFFFNEHLAVSGQGADTAVLFGPFHGNFGHLHQPGMLEMTVHVRSFHTNLATKMYKVIVHPANIFSDNGVRTYEELDGRWFRILPELENANGSFDNGDELVGFTYPNACDFDMDIAYRFSEYTNNDFDVWLRFIQKINDPNGLDIFVTIRTTLFEQDTPINTKKQLVQVNDTVPKPFVGYLGFHSANHVFHDSENAATKSPFRGNQWESSPWRPGPLRIAQDVQRTLTLNGTPLWSSAFNFKWTGSYSLQGIGKHRNGLSTGTGTITLPATGAVIPVMGKLNTTVTVSANGIALAKGQSLYCGIPPAATGELNGYLFIVDSTDGEYQLPEWAVFLAGRPLGSTIHADMIKLHSGRMLDCWHILTLLNGWTVGAQSFRFRVEDSDILRLEGELNAGTKANNTSVAVIPVGYRPDHAVNVEAAADNQSTGQSPHFFILTDGTIACWGLALANGVGIHATFALTL